jgi:arsenate reductase (glutaredoxin)
MKIYHNPRCGKSRQTLKIIREKGVEPQIVEYLVNPPTEDELRAVLKMLNMKPYDLIRRGEAIFKENFKGRDLRDDEWIKVMVENPKLIERPIVIDGDKAILGRPPENVIQLL